jgi:UDP-N-acetylmuramoylalanine--D-glutamate ligase
VGERPLVLGFAVTGAAVVAALRARGVEPVVVDDRALDDDVAARSARAGVDVLVAPDSEQGWTGLLTGCSCLLPSPGVPDHHPAFAAARTLRVPVRSELDLAQGWDPRPMVAITGTNGKTTVTTLVTAMLRASGRRAVEAGNTDVPLVAAIDDPDVEVFVVEASSFRLGHSAAFAPQVATWLNFAPDHLDVHASLHDYEQSKARLFAHLSGDATAVVNADDPVVRSHAPAGVRTVTFGLGGPGAADWTVRRTATSDELVGPAGAVADVDELWRRLPHDLSNGLAATATALAAGATLAGCHDALVAFDGLAHRVQLVGEQGGVRYFDDSKATTPHATLAAVSGFESVVLIAGGRNKGLDLSVLADAAPRVRAVVAIGDAADEVAAAFAGVRPVEVAPTMDAAVRAARRLAEPGDAVVLSPGCASFDWYRSYGERGDDFRSRVLAVLDAQNPPTESRRTVP